MRTTRSLDALTGLGLCASLMYTGCILNTNVGYEPDTTTTSDGGGGAGGGTSGDAPVILYDYNSDTGIGIAWGITVDADNVYITDAIESIGRVVRVPKSGGPATDLYTGANLPTSIATDGTDVYVMEVSELRKVPVAGGAPVHVADVPNAEFPDGIYGGLAVDADNVYWTTYAPDGSVQKLAKSGGSPVVLDASAEWPSAMVVTSGNVYWAAKSADGVQSTPIGGGPITSISTDPHPVRWSMTADATTLYWITDEEIPQQIWSAPLDGSTPPALLATLPTSPAIPSSLLVDDDYLYFANFCNLFRMPKGGGAILTTSPGEALGCPYWLAQDEQNLYYTATTGVVRYPKSAL